MQLSNMGYEKYELPFKNSNMGCVSHKKDRMPAELFLPCLRHKLIVKIGTIQKGGSHDKRTDYFPFDDPADWCSNCRSPSCWRSRKASLRKRPRSIEWMMDTVLTIVLGLLLRIGIPVTVTALIFYLLRRLDERWQKEAKAIPVINSLRPCWEIKGCSEEKRKNCKASTQPDVPCWQLFRTPKGLLREDCLGCKVFRLAPVPGKA